MKKIVALICALAMAFSISACTSNPSAASDKPAQTSSAASNNPEQTATGEPTGSDYTPSGEFNIRVFAAAGGVADVVTRIAAQGLQEQYGVTPLVNNLTGANGAVAVADMNAYDPSINELSVVSMGLFTMGPLMNPELDIHFEDYSVVASLIRDEFVLFVSKDSGITSWEDLVAYAADHSVTYASNTPGGNTHIVQTALFGDAGITAEALTSSGSNQDILAVMSGDAICTAATITLGQPYVESGDLIPLLVFSENECTAFEGITVPSVTSLGYNVCVPSINFIVTRAGVSEGEIMGLYNAIIAYRKTDSFKEAAAAASYTPDNTSPEELAAEISRVAAVCEEIFNKYY